ncbi:hypothetical protein DPMN_084574 [Dreissena polymorpha]|uniref:Uncharacterized protein n=1 Tax=Dreissena polymorpha TaxID=45954 RepID=A0A9D4BJI3_DREPO|nr:hypothetical protein DPMN_084574 [Dreissena polymorpha]
MNLQGSKLELENKAPHLVAVFLLIQDIIGTNLQTKFHDDRKINVTSGENDPPPNGHAFLPIQTIFKLNSHIQTTHILTKFHEHCTKNVTSRVETALPPGGHVFSQIWAIFELFHDDLTKIGTSTRNTAPPPGGHVFQRTGTIFELNQHII